VRDVLTGFADQMVEHVIWANYLYFPCLLLLSIFKLLVHRRLSYSPLVGILMDKVHKPRDSKCYTPTSVPIRTHSPQYFYRFLCLHKEREVNSQWAPGDDLFS
jgi:hypothetical protein